MTVRPILFSAPMVRALLDGRKTMTRRALKPPIENGSFDGTERGEWLWTSGCFYARSKPRFAPGDLLWVRETWNIFGFSQDGDCSWPLAKVPSYDEYKEVLDEAVRGTWDLHYAASPINDLWHDEKRWRPSIHMPRWASRLTLAVTAVKVERLQAISEDDTFAEGVCSFVEGQDRPGSWEGITAETDRRQMVDVLYGSGRRAFMHLWETVNGADAWALNPWVVALTFTVHRANVDALPPPAKEA